MGIVTAINLLFVSQNSSVLRNSAGGEEGEKEKGEGRTRGK